MTTVEDRYYDPPEPLTDNDRITHTCVYEVDRLGITDNCGIDLPDDAEPKQLFCQFHQLALAAGQITWEEYRKYRAHYGA